MLRRRVPPRAIFTADDGGFEAFGSHLADDHALGRFMRDRGLALQRQASRALRVRSETPYLSPLRDWLGLAAWQLGAIAKRIEWRSVQLVVTSGDELGAQPP